MQSTSKFREPSSLLKTSFHRLSSKTSGSCQMHGTSCRSCSLKRHGRVFSPNFHIYALNGDAPQESACCSGRAQTRSQKHSRFSRHLTQRAETRGKAPRSSKFRERLSSISSKGSKRHPRWPRGSADKAISPQSIVVSSPIKSENMDQPALWTESVKRWWKFWGPSSPPLKRVSSMSPILPPLQRFSVLRASMIFAGV